MSFVKDNSLQQRMAEVETLVAALDGLADSAAGQQVRRVLELVLEMHREALKRTIRLIKDADAAGDALLGSLAQDELVAELLLLHNLHPLGAPQRIALAVEKLRPYLQSHQGDLELVSITDGMATLRMLGSCGGCPSMANSLKQVIEKALYDAAPDLAGIHVESPPQRAEAV